MPASHEHSILDEIRSHRRSFEPTSPPLDDLSKRAFYTSQGHTADSNPEEDTLLPQSSEQEPRTTSPKGKLKERGNIAETQPLVTDNNDNDSAGSDFDHFNNQMPRKKAQQSDLHVSPPVTSSGASTAQNGHVVANGGAESPTMNKSMEMRRKNASLDSPSQAANLMSRETFSLDDEPPPTPIQTSDTSFLNLPLQDQRNFLLLVLLYFLQGVPMGLAMGSVPFLLKPHLSYSQLGVFSLASYPYSLKLLWSPIVDAVWSRRLGRRKSWILPIQFCSAFGLLYMGSQAEKMMKAAGASDGSGVWTFTGWWFFLVFLCATQDIAVDGWALTLLSPSNISYASTAQTVGLTAGQFMSYTVFLAFNAPDFANRWFRKVPSDVGLLTLSGYLTFAGWAYLIVTIGLAVLKREEKTKERDGIIDVYKSMLGVLKLRNIQSIIIIHLIAKIGFQANDAVTNLKLLDKGFSQEDLALTVLIDFPFEISLGYYAGRWSAAYPALHVWSWAFIGRLLAAMVAQGVVMIFPKEGTTTGYLLTVIASHIFSTFTSTVMFVAISAFHARVSDPGIGGTYMTLLATVSNLGGTFPRFFVLKLVDTFTTATCYPPGEKDPKIVTDGFSLVTSPFSCAMAADKDRCVKGAGTCQIVQDGYYITNVVCVIIGVLTFWAYIRPASRKLQALPLRAWRIASENVGRR